MAELEWHDLERKKAPKNSIVYPTLKNSEKTFFQIRIPNFCYIQVIVFDLGYLQVAAVGT